VRLGQGKLNENMRHSCPTLNKSDVRDGKKRHSGRIFRGHTPESSVYWYLGMNTGVPLKGGMLKPGPTEAITLQRWALETNRLAPGFGVI
jgi:hypothetical protein